MIMDNGHLIIRKCRNGGSILKCGVVDGRMMYQATNRAGRRYLESGALQTIVKNNNLELDLENYTVA